MINSPALMFSNPILVPVIMAYLSAQIMKVMLTLLFSRKLDFRRLVGAGGMPSSHSSVVVSLATSVGIRHGWDSTLFAISVAFAIVVMYDAQGVRRAAGHQAALLNRLMRWMKETGQKPLMQGTLTELLGHTPFEIIAGACLGAFISILFALRG